MAYLKISGILPPIITPFHKNGQVDYHAFVRNIEKWNKTPLGGYLVLGSNSEAAYLTEQEKLELIQLTVKTAGKGRFVLAGTGLESTRETTRLTNKAAELGARAALILTPCYYGVQMTDKALIRHFTQVADAADIPIFIYNVPKFTHLNISVEAVRVLSRHPNIIGMKDSRGDIPQLEAFLSAAPKEFNLIVGSAPILYPALALGIKAGILALANCAPAQCAEIQELYDKGEREKAKDLQARMLPINKAISDTYGIAGLKYASTLMGYEGGYVRSPLLPIDRDGETDIRQILERAGILPR